MSSVFGTVPWGPLLFIFLAGAIPTHVWRWLGVILAGRIKEESETLIWVRAIATALVAGVIAQLAIKPTGALAETELWVRLAAVAVGFAIFLPFRQTLVSVLAGTATLIGLSLFTGLSVHA